MDEQAVVEISRPYLEGEASAVQHGGTLITDDQVRALTWSIFPGHVTASGTWSIGVIFQHGLNLLVVIYLTTLIHGIVAKLGGGGGILVKLAIKPIKGWCLSINSKAP